MKLSIKNLSKSFDNKLIFSNFSYDFPECGIVLLVGDSGVGKTTLLRLIAGLDSEYEGEIFGGGVGNVSFAFQEYRLFPSLTALDNVIFANCDRKCEAEIEKSVDLLLKLGFSKDDMNLYPSELSGGMKQRVSLTRAFAKQSPVLLLDEPTKELDPENARLVKNIIIEEAKKRLVIMVTHNSTDVNELNSVKITINN